MTSILRASNDKYPLASVYIKPKPGAWWVKADPHLTHIGSANTLHCGYIDCKTGSENKVDPEVIKLFPDSLEGGYTLYLVEKSISELRAHFKPNFNDTLWPDYVHDIFKKKRSISVWIITEHIFTQQGMKKCGKALRLCYDKYGNLCGDKSLVAGKMYIL